MLEQAVQPVMPLHSVVFRGMVLATFVFRVTASDDLLTVT
jgi:hypothetical protein